VLLSLVLLLVLVVVVLLLLKKLNFLRELLPIFFPHVAIVGAEAVPIVIFLGELLSTIFYGGQKPRNSVLVTTVQPLSAQPLNIFIFLCASCDLCALLRTCVRLSSVMTPSENIDQPLSAQPLNIFIFSCASCDLCAFNTNQVVLIILISPCPFSP